ncbi:hypothetical protein OQA88_1359 [Cercophora sp. LCS_1]
MPAVARSPILLGFALTLFTTSGQALSSSPPHRPIPRRFVDAARNDALQQSDSEPDRLIIPGLSVVPSVLSSILNPKTTLTNGGLPQPQVSVAPSLSTPPAPLGTLASVLTNPLGSGAAGSLASALNTAPDAAGALTGVSVTLTLPLPTPDAATLPPAIPADSVVVPLLTALIPTTPPPEPSVSALVAELTPLVSLAGTGLPSVLPQLESFQTMMVSGLATPMPEVSALSVLVESEKSSLLKQIFSSLAVAVTELPVLSVQLPSSTIGITLTGLATQLSVRLPTNTPMAQFSAALSGIMGSEDSALVGSIVGAVSSTLRNVAPSNQ